MILRLDIQNFAIIDRISLEFSPKLNIITGETGAGKSILLGALGLLMGERATANQMLNENEKGYIEAVFDIKNKHIKSFFDSNDLEYSEELIIRRELLPGGKSRAFVNDSPCTIQLLQELGLQLVDIHSQHDSLELKSPKFQLEIVDSFADNNAVKEDFLSIYSQWKEAKKELDTLIVTKNTNEKNLELKSYHYEELQKYDIENWSWNTMESDLDWLENSVEIKNNLMLANRKLVADDINISDYLTSIFQSLKRFDTKNEILQINERLIDIRENCMELARDIDIIADKIEFDEQKIVDLQAQIQFGVAMMKKHGVATFSDLVALKNSLYNEVNLFHNLDGKIATLQTIENNLQQKTLELAEKLSVSRKEIAPIISAQMIALLKEMQMEESQFVINIQTKEQWLSDSGMDTVQFLFSANKGKAPQEIKNAISGGEMSRFMLGLKSLLASKIQLPTLIFDEIDTGVSGAVASKVAAVLERLSLHHQIIAITHLPQIASKGDSHLMVYKETNVSNTLSKIKHLNSDDRILEIAKMISGDQMTDTSLAAARELLNKV